MSAAGGQTRAGRGRPAALRRAAAAVGLAACGGGGAARAAPPELGVLGDSLSTGAATHPALTFDGRTLWDVFSGRTSVAPRKAALPADLAANLADPPPPPLRLWPTPREFFGGPDWLWRNTLQALSRAYLDTAEYSWGYLLGAGLGVPAPQVALAGEDGARVGTLPRHLDRLLDAGDGVLPRRVAILYTGNDLCGATLAQTTAAADFEDDLERGLRYLLRNGQPPAAGTDVYVLSYLGVVQLLTSESILSKKVRAFGGETSCRALRQASYRPPEAAAAAAAMPPEAWWFALLMPPNPAAFCATLFAPAESGDGSTMGVLANRIRAYRESQVAVVARLAAPGGNVRLHYVAETAALEFAAEDIAEDCFHLSVAGQAKVARAALGAVRAAEHL